MPKQTYLPEADIQNYEAMDYGHLSAHLGKLGISKGADLFLALLRSYRIAAHVANAAWGLVKELEAGGPITPETWLRIMRSLHDYSPGNFPPHPGDIEYCCHVLERLYDRMDGHPDRLACISMLYQEIEAHHKMLPRL